MSWCERSLDVDTWEDSLTLWTLGFLYTTNKTSGWWHSYLPKGKGDRAGLPPAVPDQYQTRPSSVSQHFFPCYSVPVASPSQTTLSGTTLPACLILALGRSQPCDCGPGCFPLENKLLWLEGCGPAPPISLIPAGALGWFKGMEGKIKRTKVKDSAWNKGGQGPGKGKSRCLHGVWETNGRVMGPTIPC